MERSKREKPLLSSFWPAVALELEEGLKKLSKAELAKQIEDLRIESVCSCRERFCQSIFIESSPFGGVIPTTLEVGTMQVDVVAGRICFIEILDHDELIDSFEKLTTLVGATA